MDYMPRLIELAQRAGEAILEVYERDIEVETKDDESPLTQADLASHRVLVAGLEEMTPDIPIMSEEGEQYDWSVRSSWDRYWLIDPLDGTKEFINRNGEFTVNVALIDGHKSVLGVVGVPVQGVVYTGDAATGKAQRHSADGVQDINGRPLDASVPLTVVASRSHGGERLETYLEALAGQFNGAERTPVGSSLKLCILAEGRADIYPRLGPTSEWDIAAAHAVLSAAGGDLWAADGSELDYNAKESVLNPEFIAVSDGSYPWREKLPAVPEK